MSEQKKLRRKIAVEVAREPHEVIADAIRAAGQDIAAQLAESFGPRQEVRLVTDGAELIKDELQKAVETPEDREARLRHEIRGRVLKLCGFEDGGEVTADGSASNDLAHERADALMVVLDAIRLSGWPEAFVPLDDDAPVMKRLQAIRQHVLKLCTDDGSDAHRFARARERADVVLTVASLARTHPDPESLLPRAARLGEWLSPGTRVMVHLGKEGESEYPAVVEPESDTVTVRLDGSGVVTDFPRKLISKEGEPWTPPKPTNS